jgi:hypothetical protein
MLVFSLEYRSVEAKAPSEFVCKWAGEQMSICKHKPTGNCFVQFVGGYATSYAGGVTSTSVNVCQGM